MSEEKKELKKNEELCEGTKALSIDELEQVNGGVSGAIQHLTGMDEEK